MSQKPLELKYKAAGFLVAFALLSGFFAVFNFAQSQYYEYQNNQAVQKQEEEKVAEDNYWRDVSGDELLNVKSVVAQKTVQRGQDLSVEFCREPKTRIVATNNIRTFYLDEAGEEVVVKQRNLPDGIEYESVGDTCPEIKVLAKNQPQETGTYRFCQRFQFVARSNEKIATFCSTQYEVI